MKRRTRALIVVTALLAVTLRFPFVARASSMQPPPEQFPYIPQPIQLLFWSAVLWATVNGLKNLGEWFGRDLSGAGTVLALAVTGSVLYFINAILAALPADIQPIVATALGLVVMLLTAMGFKRVEVKARPVNPVVLQTTQARVTPGAATVSLKHG
jgi:hypothetical protein